MTMKESSSLNNFSGYAFFLLNSDDGNIYVLSLSEREPDKKKQLVFIPKEEMDPEMTVVSWEDNLINCINTLMTNGVLMSLEVGEKQDEILPIKVNVERNKETGKTTITIDDNF